MTTFDLNGRTVSIHSADDTPLLWVIRDELSLTGTNSVAESGLCGACTVHVKGGHSILHHCGRAVAGAKVTTIEGLNPEGRHPVQVAWTELQVPNAVIVHRDRSWQRHTSEGFPESHRPRQSMRDGWEPLPLHDLHSDTQGHQLAAARMRGGIAQ